MKFSLFPLVLAAMTTSKAYSFSSSAVGGTFLSAEQKLALKTTAELVATPGKGITGTYRTGGNESEWKRERIQIIRCSAWILFFFVSLVFIIYF